MTNQNNMNDAVDIPESAPEDFGSQATKKGLSPAVKFGVVIVLVFAVIGASLFLGGNQAVDPTSSIKVNADLDATPGGQIQSDSPQFQALLEQANDEAASAAIKEGRTFIPTPENILRPIDDLQAGVVTTDPAPEPETEPEPVPVAVEPEAPSRPVITAPPAPAPAPRPQPAATSAPVTQEEEQENPYTNAMVAQMGVLARTSNQFSDLKVQAIVREETAAPVAETSANNDATQAGQAGMASADDVLIAAGDIIYAETITSTNSDASGSPVLVELTTGQYRGARMIGKFAVNDVSNSLIVEFTSMTLPDGSSADVSAYAVDGMTAETSVASDVDRRYFARYGAILASSFITSFADAKSDAGQTLTSIGDEVAIVEGARDAEQSLYAGLSAAANAIGSDIVKNAPKGPKVTLRDGWPLAILFMEPVVVGN